jgi:hypothetical protein
MAGEFSSEVVKRFTGENVCFSASRKASPQTQHPRSGLSCRFWDLSCRRLFQSGALVNKQPALPADPAAISAETPISTDDAVARNHNGNRVRAVGQANSTDRFRAPQLTRQRAITQRRSGSDRPECRPNLALKGRASAQDHRDRRLSRDSLASDA